MDASAEDEKILFDQDGDMITGKCLRIMDWIGYAAAPIPFLLLAIIAGADKRVAVWSAFIACLALLMLDYFRSRYYRTKISYPDIIPVYSFVDFLALGIASEIVTTVDSLSLAPAFVTLLLFGCMISMGFHEVYPLHSSDCRLYALVKVSAHSEMVRRNVFAVWVVSLAVIMIFAWCSIIFPVWSVGHIILGIILPCGLFCTLTLATPYLVKCFLDKSILVNDEETRRLV